MKCACCGKEVFGYVVVNGEVICNRCDADLTADAEAQLTEDIAEFNAQRMRDVEGWVPCRFHLIDEWKGIDYD